MRARVFPLRSKGRLGGFNYNAGFDGVLTVETIAFGERQCLAARLRFQEKRGDGKEDVVGPLYEPVLLSFSFGTLTLRGFESLEGAGYAQEWRCMLGATRA